MKNSFQSKDIDLFNPHRMIKDLNETPDINGMQNRISKELNEEALQKMIDNLKEVKMDFTCFRQAREIKNKNPAYYREWNIDQVGNWIDSIENGKYSDYSATMKTAMEHHRFYCCHIKITWY